MAVYLPPWLDINSRDFLAAAQGGARIGAELAGQASERGIASARNATDLQEAQMRENTAMSGQQAEAALAQARLEQAAKQQQAEQLLRQWEVQQQIKRQQDMIAGQNERAANALAERQNYGNSMLDIRREANRIAQQRADAAENKTPATDFATAHTGEIKPHDVYTINVPGKPPGTGFLGTGLFASKGVPESSITTTNAADLMGVPGNQITTNTIPGTPAMTWKIPRPTSQPNRPTRAQAADYVSKYGTNAVQKLKEDGFDPSGYAD